MIDYVLKSTILLLAFYMLYSFVLRKESALNFNRAYLIVTLVVSLAIPAISFDFLQLPGSIITDNTILINYQNSNLAHAQKSVGEGIAAPVILSAVQGINTIYFLVVSFLSIRFFTNLYVLVSRIINKRSEQKFEGFNLIKTEQPVGVYSFYNTIFISQNEFVNNKLDIDLLRHEQLHLKQKHFIDILIIELFQIAFWFNPIILLYKKSIKENHEILADRYVAQKSNNITAYAEKIIAYTTKSDSMLLASGFGYSSIKHRIKMINKPVNQVVNKTKLLFATLMGIAIILMFSAFSVLETKDMITKRRAVKTIREININTDYHNEPFIELEELANSSTTNFGTFVIIAKLVQNFGHSTDPIMQIARHAAEANTNSDLYNELAMLVFLEQNTSPKIYVDLAVLVSRAKSKQELKYIKNRIETLKENTQFESIKMALEEEHIRQNESY